MLTGLSTTPAGPAVNALARRYARARILADLRLMAERTELPGQPGVEWLDTRPMTDHREVSADSAEMAELGLGLAETCRLIVRHPQYPHLVRLIGSTVRP